MISVITIMCATFLYGVFHSVLASHKVKGVLQPLLGRGYRLFFNLVAGITILPLFALVVLLPDQPLYSFPSPWRWILLATQGLALVALFFILLQTDLPRFLGLRQLMQKETLTSNTLQINGFYRAVRHPLYFFSLVLLWASPDMSWNKLALWLGFSLYLWGGAILEERKLAAQFGSVYAEYQRRVPMLIPYKVNLWRGEAGD